MPFSDAIVVMLAAFISAGSAAIWLRQPSARRGSPPQEPQTSLLFEDGVLLHVSDAASQRFALEAGTDHWDDLRKKVIEIFPDFPDRPARAAFGDARLIADDPAQDGDVVISWRGAMTHVAFGEERQGAQEQAVSKDTQAELATLRSANASVPHPVWKTDTAGTVIWHNPSYAQTYQRTRGAPVRTDEPLFGSLDLSGIPSGGQRASLRISGTEDLDWFYLTRTNLPDGAIFNASCLNAVVKAEEAQRNFVQTLAKTFAHLSIGLAIFDRKRQLALFNPALIDLTALPAEFLSARPTMVSFFDRLRENRRMPEPKNYRNWRQEIAEVIAAANDGRYQETWSLESGQTYKVSGRPHPDGATAFLIEDITAEVSVTRNFRAELELAQCLLDTLKDGLAVFSASGRLIFSNTLYQDLWGLDPESSFVDFTIGDSVAAWKDRCAPCPRWQKIEDFVLSYGDRKAFDVTIRPKGRAPIVAQIVPIVSGATLVRFCDASVVASSTVPAGSMRG